MLTLVLFIPAGLSSEYTPAAMDAIICFTDTPDLQLLREYDVTVLEIYNIIPAVHALIPLKYINPLEQNANIAYIAENSQIQVSTTAVAMQWPLQLINAPTAWEESIGEGIRVAVLDTGIAPINDLKVYGGYNFVERNADTTDRNGHGTMIASIIATQPTSSTGLIGVAPGVELYAVKTLNNRGIGTSSQAILGIQWAIEHDMQIISMSWGSSHDRNSALKHAADVAYDKGILIVAAAGNSGETSPGVVEYPAKYNTTIAVAAVKADGSRLEISSFGPEIELAAPGENVYGISLNNQIYSANGTSMAVPYVTGTAALVWAKNISLTNTEVRNILYQTATKMQIDSDTDQSIYYGYGIVNATAAVQATPNASNSTTNSLTITNQHTSSTPNHNNNINNNNSQQANPSATTKTNTPTTTTITSHNNTPNNSNNDKGGDDQQANSSATTKTNTPTTTTTIAPYNNMNAIIIASIMAILIIINIIVFSVSHHQKHDNP